MRVFALRAISSWLWGKVNPHRASPKKPTGYELELEAATKADTYYAQLVTWEAGVGYSEGVAGDLDLPLGSRLAIVCTEGVIPCQAGYAGLEGAGNLTRLKNFAAGPLPR